jgi:hypothetical protein
MRSTSSNNRPSCSCVHSNAMRRDAAPTCAWPALPTVSSKVATGDAGGAPCALSLARGTDTRQLTARSVSAEPQSAARRALSAAAEPDLHVSRKQDTASLVPPAAVTRSARPCLDGRESETAAPAVWSSHSPHLRVGARRRSCTEGVRGAAQQRGKVLRRQCQCLFQHRRLTGRERRAALGRALGCESRAHRGGDTRLRAGVRRAWVGIAARTRPRADPSASLSATTARLATPTQAMMLMTHTLV